MKDAAPRLGVELAIEPLRERELRVVGELLIAEYEDGVLIHPRPDLGERLAIVNPGKIDRAHLGGEVLVKLSECEGHGFNESRTTFDGESSGSCMILPLS